MKSSLQPFKPPHPDRLDVCPRHSKKELRPLLERAHELGAHVERLTSGHFAIWHPDRAHRAVHVSGTPKSATEEAKAVRRRLQQLGLAD